MKIPSMRRGLAGLGVLLAVLAIASPAFAHVEADGDTATDGTTTVTFSFSHGCGTAPTTGLRVQLPAAASDVKPQNPTGFTSNVADGVLTWSGGTVATDAKGTFVVTMKLTGTKGDTVFFPTIQACAQGEESWIEKTDDPEAENAAPRIVLGATTTADTGGDDHDADTSSTTPAGVTTTAAARTTTTAATGTTAKATTSTVVGRVAEPSSSNAGLIAAIVIAVLIVAGVAFYLLRGRGSPTD